MAMRQKSDNKCAEVIHWLKKNVCILWVFSIFPGDSNLCCFAVEAESTQALHA